MATVPEGERVAADGDVEVRILGGQEGGDAALAFLAFAEAAAGVPLVDESERARLERLATGVRPERWDPLLATHAGAPAGYAGLVADATEGATADIAVDRTLDAGREVTRLLLAGLVAVAERRETDRLHAWIRHVRDADEEAARSCGFEVERRLHVLGRALSDVVEPELPPGVYVRGFEEDDAEGVVGVLAAAYAGTPDAGWDLEEFAVRRSYDWFDPADLLVATRGGDVVGVHWTKRRGDGVGEVYNLAVAPHAQGSGLGRSLLLAGLAHLATRGCDEAVLWVDADNEPGLALYRSTGFRPRWTDMAFTRRR